MQTADVSQPTGTVISPFESRPKQSLAARWHFWVHKVCGWLFFDRVTVLNRENLEISGPTIYLALHRNGAVDGFVYHGVVPRATSMISRQLRENWFFRLWFGGIEVVREKDVRSGEDLHDMNRQAFNACVEYLENEGELFIFPEGTSSLGPSHLPFKSGAVRIAAEAIRRGKSVSIVPLGVRYERPWAFRSRVEIQVGEPIILQSTPLGELRRRCNHALEEIGINVSSDADQERIHKLAYAATLGTNHSYYRALKHFETSIPADLDEEFTELEADFSDRTLLYHQGVPLFPIGARWPYLLALLPCACLVMSATVLNVLPLLGAWWASRKFADDRNVIALWKILVGIPLAIINLGSILVLSLVIGSVWPPLIYGVISVLGLILLHRTKKLGIATFNSFLHPSLRARVLAFREHVLSELEQSAEPTKPLEV